MAITTKVTGRKGGRSAAPGLELIGIGDVMKALSPTGLPREIVGIVGFNTPYALAQHERFDYNHPKGGKWKYLEDPLKQNAKRYGQQISNRIKQAVARKAWRGGITAAVVSGAVEGMTEVVEDLLGRAMREAPLDEGTLRASGTAAVLVDGRRISGNATAPIEQAAGGNE